LSNALTLARFPALAASWIGPQKDGLVENSTVAKISGSVTDRIALLYERFIDRYPVLSILLAESPPRDLMIWSVIQAASSGVPSAPADDWRAWPPTLLTMPIRFKRWCVRLQSFVVRKFLTTKDDPGEGQTFYRCPHLIEGAGCGGNNERVFESVKAVCMNSMCVPYRSNSSCKDSTPPQSAPQD